MEQKSDRSRVVVGVATSAVSVMLLIFIVAFMLFTGVVHAEEYVDELPDVSAWFENGPKKLMPIEIPEGIDLTIFTVQPGYVNDVAGVFIPMEEYHKFELYISKIKSTIWQYTVAIKYYESFIHESDDTK